MTIVELEEAINVKRDEMIKIGMTKGLTCEETVLCSQELDKLLNDHRRLRTNRKRSQATLILESLQAFFQHLQKLIALPYKFLHPFKSNRFS
ncbi:aspartyl-phosphate phosphatase Spo0E family protein [Neobacillus niacini]|uniref:aspartyl-phosphate phosphatase Spo0E family protein n=1 Tax=Neobacillus niacini TaxID=86668 RepID=UPI002FFE73A2